MIQNLLFLYANDLQIGVVHQHVVLVVALGFAQAQADLVEFLLLRISTPPSPFYEGGRSRRCAEHYHRSGLVIAGGAVELASEFRDGGRNLILGDWLPLF